MCLGVPMKIIQKKDNETAVVDMGSTKLEICTFLTPEVKEGDYVIVHAGFSISILSDEEAEYILKTIQEGERSPI
ncbi:MAG: HypC/HybG/HupF family hydrogenase formation chaperone [Candidatus Calescibacterium sp.]|nr:HypC/HybG/HupF family hydrogenase formation chaperone [Candidatus Calescibacterium sp.]MCX7971621.1 HypC/HybG/HupF family hydrogenase formation chaperone [bacterium]MDW8195829.1 HypC/HybG/HupF family hydrogenase formation chaperone [Candidatus Calescibacterium sp.]